MLQLCIAMHNGSAWPLSNLGAAHLPRTRAQARRMRSKPLQEPPVALNLVPLYARAHA